MNQFSYRVIIFDKLVYYLELQRMFKWTVCLIYGSFQFFATWNTKFAFGENPDQFQRLYLFWLRRCWRNWKVDQNIIYTIWCLVIIIKCWFSMTLEIFRTVVYVEPSIIIAQRFSNGKSLKLETMTLIFGRCVLKCLIWRIWKTKALNWCQREYGW